jgi:hypothetical protein
MLAVEEKYLNSNAPPGTGSRPRATMVSGKARREANGGTPRWPALLYRCE